jgi:hypothetical protein
MVGGTWPGQAVNRGRRYLGEARKPKKPGCVPTARLPFRARPRRGI